MGRKSRVVIDNNVLISRLLLPRSIPGQAVRRAVDGGQLLLSEATLDELALVLARPKFDIYVTVADRQEFIRQLGRIAEFISIQSTVQVCRDPKDNMFLDVGIDGGADLIVTGDKDLLAIEIFQGIPIISPRGYLEGSFD